MNEITTFKNDTLGQVRTLRDEKGDPWFVAKDVCDVLDVYIREHKGYIELDTWKLKRALDEDEYQTLPPNNTGGKQCLIINESGLYSLILRSRKPEAKRFKKWITSEVLPAIRKTGGYIPVSKDGGDDEMTIMAKALKIADRTIQEIEKENTALHERQDFLTVDVFRAFHVGAYWPHSMKTRMGQLASRLCKEREVQPRIDYRIVNLPRRGEVQAPVKIYPVGILEEAFNIIEQRK